MNLSKTPPQNIELEKAVLGAILLDKNALLRVEHLLEADCFYSSKNKIIFEKAILPLFNENAAIDILTVHSKIESLKIKTLNIDAYYISSLVQKVASSANIQQHCLILKELAIKRNMITYASEILTGVYNEDIDALDLMDRAMMQMDKYSVKVAPSAFSNFGSVMKQSLNKITNVYDSDCELTGISSGFKFLDKMTSGWQPSDLIVVAARPGMGKTTFVLELAKEAAIMNNIPTAFFSLEMSEEQLGTKIISSVTGIPLKKLKNGNLEENEWHQMNEGIGRIEKAPLCIDDSAELNIFEMKTKCRRLKHEYPNLGLIIVDYLQLIRGGDPSLKNQIREQQISYISRSLKALAKELNVPVIALSQLSRVVENRPDKKPLLSDLRESGAIEQDADIVSFLYRPDYYGMEIDEAGNDLRGMAKLIIAKHRNGGLGDIKLQFDGARSSFRSYFEQITEDVL